MFENLTSVTILQEQLNFVLHEKAELDRQIFDFKKLIQDCHSRCRHCCSKYGRHPDTVCDLLKEREGG